MQELHTTNFNLQGNYSTLWQTVAALQLEYATLRTSHESLQSKITTLQESRNTLYKQHSIECTRNKQLISQNRALNDKHLTLEQNRQDLSKKYDKLRVEYEDFYAASVALQQNQSQKNCHSQNLIPPTISSASSTTTGTVSTISTVQDAKSSEMTTVSSNTCLQEIQKQIQCCENQLRDRGYELHDTLADLMDAKAKLKDQVNLLCDTKNQVREAQVTLCKLNTTIRKQRDTWSQENDARNKIDATVLMQSLQLLPKQQNLLEETSAERLQITDTILNETKIAVDQDTTGTTNSKTEWDKLKQERDHFANLYQNVIQELKSKDDTISKMKCHDMQVQQIIQERNDALRLTEDMEIELHRLSNEVDHYEAQLIKLTPPRRVSIVPYHYQSTLTKKKRKL
jgi:DNA repair exonuclease SbcCD ATPase subunit